VCNSNTAQSVSTLCCCADAGRLSFDGGGVVIWCRCDARFAGTGFTTSVSCTILSSRATTTLNAAPKTVSPYMHTCMHTYIRTYILSSRATTTLNVAPRTVSPAPACLNANRVQSRAPVAPPALLHAAGLLLGLCF
jgi:hypothetical protein